MADKGNFQDSNFVTLDKCKSDNSLIFPVDSDSNSNLNFNQTVSVICDNFQPFIKNTVSTVTSCHSNTHPADVTCQILIPTSVGEEQRHPSMNSDSAVVKPDTNPSGRDYGIANTTSVMNDSLHYRDTSCPTPVYHNGLVNTKTNTKSAAQQQTVPTDLSSPPPRHLSIKPVLP